MVTDAHEQFRTAIAASGLTPPEAIIADGELHRFASNGTRGDDAGWYVYHGNGVPAGSFGCWRTGLSEPWRAKIGRKLTPAEDAAQSQRIADARAKREAEQTRLHADARTRAAERWHSAKPADPAHPYLTSKGVQAHGIQQEGELLLIPMRAEGKLHSLQTIAPDGDKRFLTGGRVTGCYHSFGKRDGVICIAEGYATGATIHETTGHAVAVAFNAGNVPAVAAALRAKMPDARIILCADDDYRAAGNPGMTKATEAARAVGGLVAVPDFGADRPEGMTDFNDLAQHRGAEAVRAAVERASAPEAPEDQPRAGNAVEGDSGGSAWPDPQPLTANDEPQPYPLDALPDGIRDAVAEVVGFVQCPTALAACSALSALSLVGQGLADVQRAEQLQGPTSLYLLTVAESGERKSACDGYFLRPIREWERAQAEGTRADVARSAARIEAWEAKRSGLRERIKENKKKGRDTAEGERELIALESERPERHRVPALILNDVTPEALAYTLATDWPSGGIMSSEAGIVFGGHAMGRESVQRNLALLNLMWDGAPHRVKRRTSEPFEVRGARLTMGLATQPETVRQFMEGTKGLARGMGFSARFLCSAPVSTQGSRLFKEASDWSRMRGYEDRLRELLTLLPENVQSGALVLPLLTMTPEARAAWIAFHDDVERELLPGGEMADTKDVASKAADNVARMAALFHLYAHGPAGQIGPDAVRAVARIVAWHLYQARTFLGDVAAPPERANARRLDAWLLARCRHEGAPAVERRTIQQYGPGCVRGRPALDAALAELADAARVREVEKGRLVQINPALLGGHDGAS